MLLLLLLLLSLSLIYDQIYIKVILTCAVYIYVTLIFETVHHFVNLIWNLQVDGCPSKENLFGQSALLMIVMYIISP